MENYKIIKSNHCNDIVTIKKLIYSIYSNYGLRVLCKQLKAQNKIDSVDKKIIKFIENFLN